MGVEITGNQLVKAGTIGNPFEGTEYFTNIDASTEVSSPLLTIPLTSGDGTIKEGDEDVLEIENQVGDIDLAVGDPVDGSGITIVPGVPGSVVPFIDGAMDLGSADLSFNDAHIEGTAYLGDVEMTASDILWATDGSGDIGASGDKRPNYAHVKTEVKVGDTCRVRSDRLTIHTNSGTPAGLAGGDVWYQEGLTVGTMWFRDGKAVATRRIIDDDYTFVGDVAGKPGSTSVQKIRGTPVDVTAPTTGHAFVYNGTQLTPKMTAWWLEEAVDWNSSSAKTFSNLNGANEQIYMLEFYGYLNSGGNDYAIYVNLNGDGNANYEWYAHWFGYRSGYGAQHNTSADAAAGAYIVAWTAWGTYPVVYGRIFIQAQRGRGSDSYYKSIHSDVSIKQANTDAYALMYNTFGVWRNTANDVSSIALSFGGSALTGKIRLWSQKYYDA